MDWSFFDEFETFFEDIGNFTSMIAEAFTNLPSIFKFALSFIAVVVIVAGGLKLCFKLIG